MNRQNTAVTLEELRNVVTLKDVRHFAQAASMQCLTQPTLSISLKNFEAKLGVQVIDRVNRHYNGETSEGRKIIEHANNIVNNLRGLHPAITRQMLSYAVAVDEERSFRKAAGKCGVKQSSVSAQVKKTEELLDYKIFERPEKGKNRIEPTLNGKEFIAHAKALLQELYNFEKSYCKAA